MHRIILLTLFCKHIYIHTNARAHCYSEMQTGTQTENIVLRFFFNPYFSIPKNVTISLLITIMAQKKNKKVTGNRLMSRICGDTKWLLVNNSKQRNLGTVTSAHSLEPISPYSSAPQEQNMIERRGLHLSAKCTK